MIDSGRSFAESVSISQSLTAQLTGTGERHHEAIWVDPAAAPVHAQLGVLLAAQERWDEARTALETSNALVEWQPLLTLLGSVQRELGDREAAETSLRRSLALDPHDAIAHHSLGVVLTPSAPQDAARGDHSAARAHFDRAVFCRTSLRGQYEDVAL